MFQTRPDSVVVSADSLQKLIAAAIGPLPKGTSSLIVAVGTVIVMLGGVWLVFARLKNTNKGFGPSSLKALGLVLFIPALLIISVVSGKLESQALAALLGTVAGYVLSHSRSDNTQSGA